MIPLKLHLKNFLSYGPDLQTIDFEPYSLICLSGKNGHGKSALLDAITWTLWGQARKISGTFKSDESLLRIGQTQMMVTLDFFCTGQTYRIRREYMKSYGKPYIALDFALLQEKDSFIALSGKTVRATQAIIDNTLHLDFDSFINSAFLRQGQANEFSKKSPKDRKEILGTILGLNSYESIRKLATEKMRHATTEKTTVLAYQEKIDQELNATKTVSTQLTALHQQLSSITQKEQQCIKRKQAIESQRNQMLKEQQKKDLLSLQLEHLLKEEKKQQERLQTIRIEWKDIHTKQLQLPDHNELTMRKKKLFEAITKHQYNLQQNLELKERYLTCKEQLQGIKQNWQKEQQCVLQQQIITVERLILEKKSHEQLLEQLKKTNLEQHQEKQDIENELEIYRAELERLCLDLPKREVIIKQFEKRKEYYQKFIAQNSLIQQELTNLERKQHLADDGTNPSCPLCEQNLSASRRRFLKQKFVKEERFLKHRANRITTVVKRLKKLLIEQHKEIETFTKEAEHRQFLHLKQKELQKKIYDLADSHLSLQEKQKATQQTSATLLSSIETATNQLEENRKKSDILLEENHLYQTKKQELTTIEHQLRSVAYQPDHHNQARNELQQIEQQLSTYQEDLTQIAMQGQRKQAIHEQCCTLKKLKQEKNTITKTLESFVSHTVCEEKIIKQEQELATDEHECAKRKEELLQEKGRLEHQQYKRTQLEQEYKQNQKNLMSLTETIDDYQTIAMATGKDGIQALLIQDIIPEIEQEANELLARLTDNQAQIFIESLRDLKKGGTKETLDIKISDTIGIRPYELFSGGEAFRIDFALRIAISKLLARRSGTSLQTLIIDEGFGSQDEEGLSHIMDAIYKIQDDFAKIIIVSHLSTMKDLFPVHFLVEKGTHGSTITVLEQG